ncbi:hypothetical protein [Lentzea albida]|uniref:hypothetical protein n=1 Tax=Lentzea albida TaxID=65499 RepID=UPI000B7EC909|nr:hypothetical protein [Lentzea albida]
MLFVVWLVLPPAYVVVLGRRYVRQAQEAARDTMWAYAEVQDLLDDFETAQDSQDAAQAGMPSARTEVTQELPRVTEPPAAVGKHRLDESLLARGVAS